MINILKKIFKTIEAKNTYSITDIEIDGDIFRLNFGWYRTNRIKQGAEIPGAFCFVYCTGYADYYQINELLVYKDGLIIGPYPGIGTFKPYHGMDELESFVKEGFITIRPKEGSKIIHSARMTYAINDVSANLEDDDLVKDVFDTIEILNGRDDARTKCMKAIGSFIRCQTENNLEVMKTAYYRVPKYMRRFLMGMDMKDGALITIFESQNEKEIQESIRRLKDEWEYNNLDEVYS